MEIIGAGFGRTGTLSLKVALERLGFGPCYHGVEILTSPERVGQWLTPTRDTSFDWDAIFMGFRATVDWPAAAHWRELVAHYPSAKVLLSMRDADSWYDSIMKTLYPALNREMPADVAEPLRDFHFMLRELILERTFGGKLADRAHSKQVFEAHNQAVLDAVPASHLLVYQPGDGWDPLCAFLDVSKPNEEFPRLNDTEWYRARAGLK